MSLVQRQGSIAPDEVIGADQGPWTCPLCASVCDQGPEGGAWAAHWHCWRCGWRPGIAIPAATAGADYRQIASLVAEAVRQALNSPQQQKVNEYLSTHSAADIATIQADEADRLAAVPNPADEVQT